MSDCGTSGHNNFHLSGNARSRRVYSATGTSPNSWNPRPFFPFQELDGTLRQLAGLGQGAFRNNGWISRTVLSKLSYQIGTGIVPRANTGNEEFDKQIMALYEDFKHYANYNGTDHGDIYGIQSAIVKGQLISGGGFAILHKPKPSRSTHLPLPLQIQVLDASYCPFDFHRDFMENGNSIKHGIEINRKGKVIAYHFYKTDPNLTPIGNFSDLLVVPAENVLHYFVPERVGQVRAIPAIIKGVEKAVNFEEYNAAELQRKKVRAALTGTIEKQQITKDDYLFDPLTGDPLDYNHSQLPMANIESGTFLSLMAGETMNLMNTDDAGRGYHDYQKWAMLNVSASLNHPYQLVTGDFAGVNDRLFRVIFNDVKRTTDDTQELHIIPKICRRLWVEMIDRALAVRRLTLPEGMSTFEAYRCEHSPTAFAYINPLQDVEANYKEYKYGFTDRSTIIAKRTRTTGEETDRRRAEDFNREMDLGVPSPLLDLIPIVPAQVEPEAPPVTPPKEGK